MANCDKILAIRINDREGSALKVQEILTEYGCEIRSRLGLHDMNDNGVCSPCGTLILQLCGTLEQGLEMEAALIKIPGVKAKFVDLE